MSYELCKVNLMTARKGDMMVAPREPVRAMVGVVDRQQLRALRGRHPMCLGIALAGYIAKNFYSSGRVGYLDGLRIMRSEVASPK